jgi:N-acetylneuraminic acid mutarotase
MIVWGGLDANLTPLNTGARYDPATDTWTPISTTNAPAARANHSAVWTGAEMIIWGGATTGSSGYFSDGARYNPVTNTWTPISNVNAPSARSFHRAVWTGTEMLMWAGQNNTGIQTNGGRYNPATDTWTSVSTVNAPAARGSYSIVWTGAEMIIWGGAGIGILNTGGRYNPATDTWTATTTTNAPAPGSGLPAVWTGSEMLIYLGGRYNPATDTWAAMSTTNAPVARGGAMAVWTGSQMIISGGGTGLQNFNPNFTVGGRYNPASDSWILTCDTNAPSLRVSHTAVWTGSQMIIWGGEDPNQIRLNTGARYLIPANPIDAANFFVRRHYLDFLNREPDVSGWNFWANQILSCGSDAQCVEVKRINVSAAFFLSIEFQQTGYLVERMYKAAYGDAPNAVSTLDGPHNIVAPVIRFSEFIPDVKQIGNGVVVNQGNWQKQLDDNKDAFGLAFVQRARFTDPTNGYPTTLSPTALVTRLADNAGVPANDADRTKAINEFGGATNTSDVAARGRALRDIAENSIFSNQEKNRAFVMMQYFGYLRRDPNSGQDSDYSGYDFWLRKLNQFNGNFIAAEMVKAFITSTEYRRRFGTP